MKTYQGYILDLDGTTYVGSNRLPLSERFIHYLDRSKRQYLFMTNNATRPVSKIYDQLKVDLQLPVEISQIYTSAVAAIEYLQENYERSSKVFVLGEEFLKAEVQKAGYVVTDSNQAQVVLQALDRHLNYQRLTLACQCLLNGADFIVTNRDRLIPTELGLAPSSGAITRFLMEASEKDPFLIGKPSPSIVESAVRRMNLNKDQVLMIGDNYQTDIQAGHLAGVDTCLVLTGVTAKEDVSNFSYQPSYIINDLGELIGS